MKKFAKMSLVAAVAVAGLSSSVSAQPLAEAIQNVNVTGSVAMKYDDRYDTKAEQQSATAGKQYVFKTILNAKSKVNDDLTANVTVIARSVDDNNDGNGTQNSSLEMNHVNFIYTGWTNTTAILGKQAFDTPFTDPADPIDGADTATGYTVAYKAGPATLVGAYYSTNSVSTADIRDNNVIYLAALGSVAGVKLDAHYINLGSEQGANSAFAKGADLIKLGVAGKVAGISLSANYASLDDDDESTTGQYSEKQQTYNISASGKAGPFSLGLKYATNDEDGGGVALEHDAFMNFQGWGIAINNASNDQYDNSTIIGSISYPLNDAMSVKLYGGVNDYEDENGFDVEQEELVFQYSHSLSKNFSYYVRLGQLNTDVEAGSGDDDEEQTRGRIYGAYKF